MRAPVPVLLYHSVADDTDPRFARWAVSPADFDAHMGYLAEAGYRTLTMRDLVRQVFDHLGTLPERTLAITFDDGFEDFYRAAWPSMCRHGVTATVFVATGYVDATSAWLAEEGEANRRMMTWSQIAEVSADGVECGAHTDSHPQLDRVPRARVRAELQSSRQKLEAVVGPVDSFAYPHGYYSRRVIREVRSAGFGSACTVGDRMGHAGVDRYAIPRIIVPGGLDVEGLERALRQPPRRTPAALRRVAWRAARRSGVVGGS